MDFRKLHNTGGYERPKLSELSGIRTLKNWMDKNVKLRRSIFCDTAHAK